MLLFPPLNESIYTPWVCWKLFSCREKSQNTAGVEGGWQSGCMVKVPLQRECHRLMIVNSVRILEGGLFLKKLMLPDTCLGAIKDASSTCIWSSWVMMMKHLCCTSNVVCSAFPNPAVISGLMTPRADKSQPLNRITLTDQRHAAHMSRDISRLVLETSERLSRFEDHLQRICVCLLQNSSGGDDHSEGEWQKEQKLL